MRFFNIIANYGKQISTKSFEATECVERVSYVLFFKWYHLIEIFKCTLCFLFYKKYKDV